MSKTQCASMMADNLLSLSVSEMALTLERMLPDYPNEVKMLAEQTLEKLPMPKRTGMMPGEMTRIATLRAFKRRAERLLATSK
ncbi:hypothetical protein [Vibrio alginolyticus]|uniref:hypothetical protein n=1 Tax=Vibrio alginolyticus TaxID=663 RepID=UPI000721B4F1|nr:hypothetical protein [Vibrio alginolyticus]ALR94734.1 hypothetical protein AT730_20740 [Vibrio alginolyticus]MBY7706088.1 hypothetical protein [Vibrio alginolyticus]